MDIESIRTAVAHMDAAVFRFVNTGLAWKPLDTVMLLATSIGTGLFQSGVCVLLMLWGTLKDRVDLRRAGYAGLIAFAASGCVVQVAKFLWARPRPTLALYDVRIVGDPLFTNSFPSGHTMTAFAVIVAWSIMMPGMKRLLLALAVLTGFSRIYLGAHFPLDVIYGALLGGLVGYASVGMLPGERGPGARRLSKDE
jgi:undecaprenyl-diphosphatase